MTTPSNVPITDAEYTRIVSNSTEYLAQNVGKNPIWIVIPCHRVVGSDGSLTGYAGGVWRKKWLLEHESGAKQQTLF